MFVHARPLDYAKSAVFDVVRNLDAIADGGQLGDLLVDLDRLARTVESALIQVVARAENSQGFRDDGHSSLSGWIRSRVNWTTGDASARVRSARMMADIPDALDKLADGDLGVAQARRIARLHANDRVRESLPEAADMLLEMAISLPYEDFNSVALRWEQLTDADGAHRHAEQCHERRNATLHPIEDAVYLDGVFATAQGSFMHEVFEKFVEAEFRRDVAVNTELDLPLGATLSRTPAQRRADALYAIFTAAAASPVGGGANEPIVNILIDLQTYEKTFTAMIDGTPLPSLVGESWDLHRRRCETTAGIMIDPCEAVAASLIGTVRRVLIDSSSTVIDLGRRSRLFTGVSRDAVWLRRRRCLWPGCLILHCEVDHRVAWSKGGTTSPDNGDPLCSRHNRWKTRGYVTHLDPMTGVSIIVRPDGRALVPV